MCVLRSETELWDSLERYIRAIQRVGPKGRAGTDELQKYGRAFMNYGTALITYTSVREEKLSLHKKELEATEELAGKARDDLQKARREGKWAIIALVVSGSGLIFLAVLALIGKVTRYHKPEWKRVATEKEEEKSVASVARGGDQIQDHAQPDQ